MNLWAAIHLTHIQVFLFDTQSITDPWSHTQNVCNYLCICVFNTWTIVNDYIRPYIVLWCYKYWQKKSHGFRFKLSFSFFSVWLKFKLQSPKLKNESSKNVQSRLDYVGVGNFSLVKAETRRGWDIFQAEVALYWEMRCASLLSSKSH